MSARTKTKGVLDAEIKRIRSLLGLGGGSLGSLVPLPRDAFIQPDSAVAGADGSIAEPFKTIGAWTTSIGPTGASVADNSVVTTGRVIPATAGYAEAVSIPAWRSWELRADNLPVLVTGAVTWHNTAAAGGLHAPLFALGAVHNVAFTGGLTITDDTVSSALYFSNDEVTSVTFQGLIDLSAATHVSAANFQNSGFGAGFTSVTGVAGAELLGVSSEFVGNITCQLISAEGCTINSAAINVGVGATAAEFITCNFSTGSNPVLTTLATGGATFDGPSWRTFLEAGGTRVNAFILVIGGYAAGPVQGADLPTTGTVTSLSLNGKAVGTTAGYTAANSGNVYYSHGLGADGAAAKFLTGGGELKGDTARIVKSDLAAHALAVQNSAGTVIGTIPASSRGFIEVTFGTTDAPADWAFTGGGSLAA